MPIMVYYAKNFSNLVKMLIYSICHQTYLSFSHVKI